MSLPGERDISAITRFLRQSLKQGARLARGIGVRALDLSGEGVALGAGVFAA